MTGVDVEHTKAQLDKAQIENGEVAADRSRYRMSIPANPDRDTDLIIGAALTAAESLVAAVERAQALADDLESRAAAIEEANPTHTTQIALHRQHAAMIRQALETS